jgi:thiamine-monophosphate kinase
MIDISDGLSSDVLHICKSSKVGVIIEESKVPIAQDAEFQAVKFNLDPITCALNGGEDYELLFTVKSDDFEKLRLLPDIYIIGEIQSADKGFKLLSSGGKFHDLTAQGWSHKP